MKKDIHPENREIVFVDKEANYVLKALSTLKTEDTYEFEGKEYPAVFVEISSASHPFYTGNTKTLDTAGRVDKFKKRFEKAKS
ncbi:50S ribosomal protein L31 [Candidatus Campbellbacteria bacterium]|nr:MAG: 50S ribosomal protein L31 [Candidatus Campbellbacteria bacterium]